MIDWPGLGLGTLWALGLSLALTVACWAGWEASRAGLRLRQAWQARHDLVLDGGAFLVGLALALSPGAWWERLGGALSAAGFLGLAAYALFQVRRIVGTAPAPSARIDIVRVPLLAAICRHGLLPVSLAAVALTLLGPRPALVGMALLLALWALGWLAVRRPTVRSPLDWPLTLILLMALVGTAVSVDRSLSEPVLRSLFTGVALLLAVGAWTTTPRRLAWAAAALIAAATGLAMVALFSQTAWMSGRFFEVPAALRRLAVLPETVHTNVLAGALVLVVPVAVSLLFSRWASRPGLSAWAWRLALGLATALMLGVLVLTQSRGGLVACAAALALLAALRSRAARLALPVFAVAAALAVWRLGVMRVLEIALGGAGLGNVEGRLEVWSRALYMLQDFTFTGIGLGTFIRIAPLMYPFFIAGPDAQIPHAHNLFLQVGVDLGLPGLIAFLSLLILSATMAWQVYRRARHSWMRALGTGLLASDAALVAHGLVDAAVWGQKPSFVLWLVLGLTLAAWSVALGPGPVPVARPAGTFSGHQPGEGGPRTCR